MSPRPDVSEERKSQIVDSAIEVFTRKGFASTRMDDVAKGAGLSKGLLYWYFKSKEEIIIAIADLLFGDEFRKMQNLPSECPTVQACLESFLEIFLKDLQGMLNFAPVIYEFYALAFRNKTVRSVMKEYLHRFVAVMEPIVQKGMDDGEFAPGDARQIAITIGSTLEGTLLLWAYDPEMVAAETQLQAAMALILNGLLAKQ